MIPEYLNDLSLDTILNSYCSNVDSFLQESVHDEHVVDSETAHISGFVTATFGQAEEKADKCLTVKNPTGKVYSLLQIDNGIISTNAIKRCDCVIVKKEKLYFIEFKANATSTENKSVKKNYKKAMKQLQITLTIFEGGLKAKRKSLRKLRAVGALVCFRKGYPRLTTSEMNYKVNFALKTGGIPLSFEPQITL